MKCTWKDCNKEAEHPQLSSDGREWANLCTAHRDELNEALDSGIPRATLRAWVRASGGADILSKCLIGEKIWTQKT